MFFCIDVFVLLLHLIALALPIKSNKTVCWVCLCHVYSWCVCLCNLVDVCVLYYYRWKLAFC